MTEHIVRAEHDKQHTYVVVSTALAQDENLSFAARGMLLYLLSKPDDWQVRMGDLERASSLGEKGTRALFAELEATGYATRTRSRDSGGRWRYETVIHEAPVSGADESPITAGGPTACRDTVCRSTARGEGAHVLSMESTNYGPLRDDANASSQAPTEQNSEKKRAQSAEQRQHNAAQTAVREHFERRTGLHMPETGKRTGIATLWWNPIREICGLVDWDVGRAVRLVDATIDRLAGLTISDPNSIVKTARALAAQGQGRARKRLPGGAIHMPSSRG
jgi:hypothetical protein